MTTPVRSDQRRPPFIKAAEVWAPALDVDELVLVHGFYGELGAFGDAAASHRFLFARGLPGVAWAKRRPVVMRTDNEQFERCVEAAEAGLTSAIAIPVFAGDVLTAVLVLLCGDDEEVGGAIEVWRPTPDDGIADPTISLLDGYFGRLHQFEEVARRTHFRPGEGLAGSVWRTSHPVLTPRFSVDAGFADAATADGVEITTGFGFPVAGVVGAADYVVAFLSTSETPIARLIEIWKVARDGTLELVGGYAASGVDVMHRHQGTRIEPRSGLLGGAQVRGMPAVSSIVTGEMAVAMGCVAEVAIPVMVDGRCRSVVLFAF